MRADSFLGRVIMVAGRRFNGAQAPARPLGFLRSLAAQLARSGRLEPAGRPGNGHPPAAAGSGRAGGEPGAESGAGGPAPTRPGHGTAGTAIVAMAGGSTTGALRTPLSDTRLWQAFATVTRSLNQLDERGVAEAGIRGARTLFAPEQVEIEVIRLDGGQRRYTVDGAGNVVKDRPLDPPPPAHSTTMPLRVGGTDVGRLRLTFRRPTPLLHRERMALSAFSDALGAALHDATTHRELRMMSARTRHEASHDPLTGLINRATLRGPGR